MVDLVRRKNKTSPEGDGKGSGPGSRQRLSNIGVIKVFRVQDVSSTFVNPAETDTKYMCQICRLPRDSSRSSISSDLYKGGELSFEWPKKAQIGHSLVVVTWIMLIRWYLLSPQCSAMRPR